MPHYFFFDFDSTLCIKESLDELIYYCLQKEGQLSTEIQHRIEAMTYQGMNGEATLCETIKQRLALSTILREDIDYIAHRLCKQLTPNIKALINHLQKTGHKVTILSGGFVELITPSAKKLGLNTTDIYANQFVFDGDKVAGLDTSNQTCLPDSKSFWIHQLTNTPEFNGKTIMIGDGFNDLETKDMVDYFIGFGANVVREKVKQQSQFYAHSTTQLTTLIQQHILSPP